MRCVPRFGWSLLLTAVGNFPVHADEGNSESVRYLRSSGNKFVTECTFTMAKIKSDWSITSTTDRGMIKMEVEARYDREDRLISARATLTADGASRTALVALKNGRTIILRDGEKPLEMDLPKGTIVTSAPDWTDVFLLCRRYDRAKGGKQEFPALWIHPTQPPQRLLFSIERQGADAIKRDGKKFELYRHMIRIRGNTGYVAWTDDNGRIIRLMPLPVKDVASGMTLADYENSAAGLRPPE